MAKKIVVDKAKDMAVNHGLDLASRSLKGARTVLIKTFMVPLLIGSGVIFTLGFILGAIIF